MSFSPSVLPESALAALQRHFEWAAANPAANVFPLEPDQIDEVTEWIGDAARHAVPLWADGESNAAGVYLRGPLAGYVFILMHDDPDLSPRFESVESFVGAAMRLESVRWDLGSLAYSDAVEFPPAALDDADLADRTAKAHEVLDTADGDDEHDLQVYLAAMALLPPDRIPNDVQTVLADFLLTGTSVYLWQRIPAVLARLDYRGRGAAIAAVLEGNRLNTRWLDMVEPIRAILRD